MTSIPNEVIANLDSLNKAISSFEDTVEEFVQNQPQYDLQEPLERARTDLTRLFAVNSLYWAYLRCQGKDAKDDEELACELKRTKEYMAKLKHFDELHKRPKYEGKTVGRFMKNALFDVHADSAGSSAVVVESEVHEEISVSAEEPASKKNRPNNTSAVNPSAKKNRRNR